MNPLENAILQQKVNNVKAQLEEQNIFSERNLRDEGKKTSFSFVVYTLQRFLENYAIEENIDFVTDGSGDFDIDIFHIEEDDNQATINIFQAKHYTENNLSKTIGEKDIESFLNRVEKLVINSEADLSSCNEYLLKMNKKFLEVVNSDLITEFHINLYLVTNGSNINKKDQAVLDSFKKKHSLVKDCVVINDYNFFIDKEDKEKREISVPILGDPINMNEEINAKVVNIKTFHLAKLYEEFEENILEKNVRKLVKGKTNKDIEASLLDNPELFWYKNNGLSIVCRRMEVKNIAGIKTLSLENPYIVNGGQTTKTIYNVFKGKNPESDEEMKPFYTSSVMARVYQTTDNEIINSIVYGTNNQNKITISDLKSLNPNLRKIKAYLSEYDLVLLTKRDAEFKTKKPTISTDLLLQVYCALYFGMPHKSKISKTKLLEDHFDEVYNTVTDYDKILVAYKIYEYAHSKLKNMDTEISRHGIFSIIYTMGKITPAIKEKTSPELLEQSYSQASLALEEIILSQKNQDEDFSAHNFFKSRSSTDEINIKVK